MLLQVLCYVEQKFLEKGQQDWCCAAEEAASACRSDSDKLNFRYLVSQPWQEHILSRKGAGANGFVLLHPTSFFAVDMLVKHK